MDSLQQAKFASTYSQDIFQDFQFKKCSPSPRKRLQRFSRARNLLMERSSSQNRTANSKQDSRPKMQAFYSTELVLLRTAGTKKVILPEKFSIPLICICYFYTLYVWTVDELRHRDIKTRKANAGAEVQILGPPPIYASYSVVV